METQSEQNHVAQKEIAHEFSSWPVNEAQLKNINDIRGDFDHLLTLISNKMPPQNGRYLGVVKTKLEEACMFAIKGFSKP
ncbi:MAG: hypothetical protein JNL11_10755 [Bdellovibrionaceae bacterium]|nr:hypothetical protein [Pseudobdellovibrionaceae bacterium]